MQFDIIQKIIAEVLCIEPSLITMDSYFKDDLGTDSLDLFRIIMAIEEQFEIEFPEEEIQRGFLTVGDVVAYITRVSD